jgi:hypothetical protein
MANHKPPFHKVWIEPLGRRKPIGEPDGLPLYNVRLAATDELVVTMARDPEHDACRALKERGFTGTLETWRHGSATAAMRMGIEWGAARMTSETAAHGPETTKYIPLSDEAREKLRQVKSN